MEADGQRQRFTSRILPPYMRRSPKVAEVLPILYLRGLSTGDFREALPVLLGEDAAGLSATNIARLTAVWDEGFLDNEKPIVRYASPVRKIYQRGFGQHPGDPARPARPAQRDRAILRPQRVVSFKRLAYPRVPTTEERPMFAVAMVVVVVFALGCSALVNWRRDQQTGG